MCVCVCVCTLFVNLNRNNATGQSNNSSKILRTREMLLHYAVIFEAPLSTFT